MIEFKVSRKELLKSLQNVNNAVRDNKTIPSLSGVYLDVNKSSVEIRGTDLEATIISKLKAEVKSEGKVVIKPLTLMDYLREISDDFVTIKENGSELSIKTASSSSSYSTLSSDDYPNVVEFTPSINCTVKSSILIEGIEKTISGAATTPDNLAVHSVRLDISDEKIKLVTSDTYRLFFFEKKIKKVDGNIKVSLPLRTAASIIKIAKNIEPKNIEIGFDKNLISFKMDNIELISKVIDLPYPDYENIFASLNFDKDVLCSTEDMLSMLKRVQIFARDNSEVRNGAKFNFDKNTLKVEAISDQAKVHEELSVVKKGDDVNISLNVKFVLDYLNQISGNVLVKLKDENSAILLSEAEKTDFVCLAMPLSLG